MADGGWARSKAELMYGGGCEGVKAKLEGLAHRDETAMKRAGMDSDGAACEPGAGSL
jgi:hypothetical protein